MPDTPRKDDAPGLTSALSPEELQRIERGETSSSPAISIPIETIGGQQLATVVTPASAPADLASLATVSPELYAGASEVARGGMGRILKAEDRRLQRPVALKELHLDIGPHAARFVREALLTARLQHPSIVPIYEAGRWPNGVPFYAMKLVKGRAFDTVVLEAKTLPQRIALLPHVIAVAEAVAYAHTERIIHRDLKPANVLVGSFGETVIVDWGLAKDLSQPATDDSLPDVEPVAGPQGKTIVGTVLGTPHYMPPEQARGEAVDERADVYAVGAILYFMLAGMPPHSGKTASEALAAAMTGPQEPVEKVQPEVPQELAAIVRKAMALDKADRYPTARELATDLKRFQAGQLVSVHRYSALDLARRWFKRHRAVVTVAAVLTLGLLVSLVAGVVGIRREATRAALERDKARLEAKKAEQINAFVQGMLASADPRAQGKDVTVAQVLEEAGKRAETELLGQPEVLAAARMTIGTTYQGLGLLELAQKQLEAALETRRRVLGPEHKDVARSLTALASVIEDTGDPKRAKALYDEALALFGRLGLDETLNAVQTEAHLASAHEKLGDYAEAERLHREVLARQRKLLGDENDSVAATLNNLAVVLGQKGDWAAAETLHRQALAIVRKLKGEHVDTAGALSSLASALEARDDFEGSEQAFREALAMRRKLLGDEHPDVAFTLYNYAYMLRRKDDHAAAIARSREVLALRGKTLPDTHPLVAATLQVLAQSLIDQGQPKQAEPILRESLELRRRSLPAGHWLLGSSQNVLAGCLTTLGRYREAEPLALGGYETLRTAKGERHEKTLEALQRVIALYAAWKKPEKAAEYRALVSR